MNFLKKIFHRTKSVQENSYVLDTEVFKDSIYEIDYSFKRIKPVPYVFAVSGNGLKMLGSKTFISKFQPESGYLNRTERNVNRMFESGYTFFIFTNYSIVAEATTIEGLIKNLRYNGYYLTESEAKDALNDRISREVANLIDSIK